MPARRDYAAAWRDSAAILAQIPVAGLQAAEYFYHEWFLRSTTYLSHVSTRLALARPAAAVDATPDKSVMADVLSEDLVDATRALVQDLVLLPGETAKRFNMALEDLVRTVLERVQPDAQTDVRTYVANGLEELSRELYRLREVAAAEKARQKASGSAKQSPGSEPLRDSERILDLIQDRVDAALKRFSSKPRSRKEPDETSRLSQLAVRTNLGFRKVQDEIEQMRQEISDEPAGAAKPRVGERRKGVDYRRRGRARKRAGG